jgi:hypothetical protein
MADAEGRASWTRTIEHLERARALLPDRNGAGTDDVLDYLGHNELGLAFEVLAEVGVAQRATKPFWLAMRAAALEMKLEPSDATHGSSARTVQEWSERPDRYPCPCCGFDVFIEGPGSYDICPICGWEDDIVQLRWPDSAGGANRPCLIDAQLHFRRCGASEERLLPNVRSPLADEQPDPYWRPFDPDRDSIEPHVSGRDDGWTYASDYTSYYYWLRRPVGAGD